MIAAINAEHPDYMSRKGLWKQYRDLYTGGEQLRVNAGNYLTRRQKEPLEVYGERLAKVYYENYVGSIIDWYVATLFRREPIVIAEGEDRRGKAFLNEFTEDCDLRGSSITEFFRKVVQDAMVCGTSYVLADFPRVELMPETLAEEDRAGTGRAYLSHCTAEQLINWSTDCRGDFEWVVIRTEGIRKAAVEDQDWVHETRWLYYDRQEFRSYRQVGGPMATVEEVDRGCHAFAKAGRVPLFSLVLSDGLWLMNKAGLLQLEHFNRSNALSWALTLGLFAQPVIYSSKTWKEVIGESYYIQLGPEDRFGWTEPEGRVYQIAAENLTRLKEEIYRVCYLLSQAGGSLVHMSGASKQRDFAITQEVLRAYGDVVKDTIKRVLRAVVAVREDGLSIDVSGLDEFDIGDFAGELADAERLLEMAPSSQTLRRQVLKKLAFKYLCDVRQEVKEQISKEIDQEIEGVSL
ncbi:MAG: hypothetical protein R2729_01405 [Bryobacteraceae bacterium]